MDQNEVTEQVAGEVRKNWGWLLFMGIALVILGTIGLYMSGMLTLASVLYFGVLILAGGVLMLIDAFQAEGWKAKIWEILIALIYVAAGIMMIANPGASAIWFTMFIAAFLLASGVSRIIMGFQLRKEVSGWILTVIGGIASIILALMIFSEWPVSGIWVIGLFVAIELILQGISMISIAMAAKASSNVRAKAVG
jgi:uncharacterized membrane protein HdeD (DUF308 family)